MLLNYQRVSQVSSSINTEIISDRPFLTAMDHPWTFRAVPSKVAFKRSSGFNTPLEGTTSTTKGRETPERLKLKLALERKMHKARWPMILDGGFMVVSPTKIKGVVKGLVVIYGGYSMLQGVDLQSLLWDYYGLTNQIRG